MLKDLDTTRFPRIFIICGYTDLRKGAVKLVNIVRSQYGLEVYDKGSIFLFCGRRANTIKAITWDSDGFVLMSKTVVNGRYIWPRSVEEARQLTPEQFRLLMSGFAVEGLIKECSAAS